MKEREKQTMAHPLLLTTLFLCLLATFGCQSVPPRPATDSVRSTVPSFLIVPITVERLAVLYPRTYNRKLMDAYAQLAGAAFQLKASRPSLRIIERFDLPAIHSEQRFQLSGAVSDETVLSVGRLLGVDSVLLYQIEGPNVRDRILAKLYGELPPFTVTSKVIRVESAEVVYFNVVTVPVVHTDSDDFLQPLSHVALDRGIAQTIADLQHAFR